jgi:hypothetical protein
MSDRQKPIVEETHGEKKGSEKGVEKGNKKNYK